MVALAFEVRAEQECAPQVQAVYRTWLELAAKSGAKTQIACFLREASHYQCLFYL